MAIMADRGKREIKIYTALIALLPIISIYASGIPGVNLGELFLIVFLYYTILFNRKSVLNQNKEPMIVIFGGYIILSTLLSLFIDSSQTNNVIIRMLRFVFYLFVIFYLSRKFFDFEYASKLIMNASALGTIYIIIQNIFYRSWEIVLKGFVPFLSVYNSQYETTNYSEIYQAQFYRPTSFFLEPAHYSQYALIGLVAYLFSAQPNRKNLLLSAFLTFGIVLSTSGQGIMIAGIIWVLFVLQLILSHNAVSSNRNKLIGVALLFFAAIISPFALNSQILKNTIARVFSSGASSAVSARTEGYVAFFMNDNVITKVFGVGFGNTPYNIWFSGLAYILYCSGIIGFLILCGIFLTNLLKSKSKYVMMIIIVAFILSVSAEIINSYWIVFMFSLFCYSKKKTVSENICECKKIADDSPHILEND